MKELFISILIFLFAFISIPLLINGIGFDDAIVGMSIVAICFIYIILFFKHVKEMIQEKNLLYVLSRGNKSGSFIRKIKSLTSRKKQYQELLAEYEHKFRDLLNSSADQLITVQNSKQVFLKNEISNEQRAIEQIEKETEEKMKEKNNIILELVREKEELIKRIEAAEKSKRKKIDTLKKNISKEKNLYKELQTRHKLIDKWVNNR
jgi:Ca2+/Na+ antiporter